MTTQIARFYESAEAASGAADALEANPHFIGRVRLVPPPATGAAPDAALKSVLAVHIARAETPAYVAALEKGLSLVVVYAGFGSALAATRLLDSYGPTPVAAIEKPVESTSVIGQAAPFSDFLSFPVLSNSTAPFSRMWALPMLTRKQGTTSAAFGWPELKPGLTGKAESFGIPLLLRNPTPLSSMLKLPTIVHHR